MSVAGLCDDWLFFRGSQVSYESGKSMWERGKKGRNGKNIFGMIFIVCVSFNPKAKAELPGACIL